MVVLHLEKSGSNFGIRTWENEGTALTFAFLTWEGRTKGVLSKADYLNEMIHLKMAL